jgi:hypothetical protein
MEAALRKENKRLHTKIVDLERKLISAKHRIAALESDRKANANVIRVQTVYYDEMLKQLKLKKDR